MSIDTLQPLLKSLKRYPETKDPNLRAWNAADEYLLSYLSENSEDSPIVNSPLIVNDQFGALTTGLKPHSPFYWTDSFLSDTAISGNLTNLFGTDTETNALRFDFEKQELVLKSSDHPAPEKFELVLLKVPKHLSLLEWQLSVISQRLRPTSFVIASGMTKEIHNSTLALFEKWIGPTKTSLARKKSRLIFSSPAQKKVERSHGINIEQYDIANPLNNAHELKICGMPGVFSRNKLDQGTQVLFQYLPPIKDNAKIVDLGCGSGVIGAAVAQMYPNSSLTLTDESELAIESARRTFQLNALNQPQLSQTDVLDRVATNTFDYILCNPPFHQQNTQTLSIANKMFRQSAKCLTDTGSLFVIANRHLKYGGHLKKYFANVKPISDHARFILWQASSPR